MFSNVFIVSCLFILNGHLCSGWVSKCSPATYPVKPDWIFENETLPPANLTQNLTKFDNGTGWITVFVNDQRENFTLTLLANPFDKNGSKYPELNTSDYNLRQFYTTCTVAKVDNLPELYYHKIFTGWYYLVMTNEEGKRWQYEPRFYETTYPFIDTRVQLESRGVFKPETTETTMQYSVDLRVPLDCIVVRVKLYECQEKIDGAMKHIEHGRMQQTQSCWIKNDGEDPYALCDLISHVHLSVSGTRDTHDNTWIVNMIWKNLTRGGGHYYLDYSGHDLRKCEQKFGPEAVETWRLIKDQIYFEIGESHFTDTTQRRQTKKVLGLEDTDWLWITCLLAGLIFSIILYYFVLRWRRLKNLLKDEYKCGGIAKEPLKFIGEKESNQILLIYVRGCLDFEKELEDFKQRLGRYCNGYKIRDVYAASEWTNVNELGSRKWVEQQFEAGSMVIWFDTPQLRSRLNYPEKNLSRDDFRDEAVPYAFELARELCRDVNTQYRRHFVVQMEAFKVEDHQGDPLQVLTPHARYLLPGLFPVLCEHLKGPMESSRKHENLYTKIKFDSSSYNRTACMI